MWSFLLLTGATLEAPPDVMLQALVLDFRQDGTVMPREFVEDLYRRACSTGYRPACMADQWLVSGLPSLGVAATTLAPFCDAGDALACIVLGWEKTQIEPGIPTPDAGAPVEGAALFQKACDAGSWRACGELGTLYAKGVGVTKDPDRARDLRAAACDAGSGNACEMLAISTDDDLVRPALHRRACELGDMIGCFKYGRNLDEGEGVAQDGPAAMVYHQRSCDGGHARGCYSVGYNHETGQGVPFDWAAAVGPYRQACDLGYASACNNLGGLVEFGHGVTASRAEAIRLYERGRDLGSEAAVRSLARLREDDGDATRAAGMYEVACDARDERSCHQLGLLTLAGTGVPRNATVAATLFSKACELGDERACVALAEQQARGEGVALDLNSAGKVLEDSCSGGRSVGCERLGWYRANFLGASERISGIGPYARACESGRRDACVAASELAAEFDSSTLRAFLRETCVRDHSTCRMDAEMTLRSSPSPSELGDLKARLKAACADRNGGACRVLGIMLATGDGAPVDLNAALYAWKLACGYRDALACDRVTLMATIAGVDLTKVELARALGIRRRTLGPLGAYEVDRLRLQQPVWKREPAALDLPEEAAAAGVRIGVCELRARVDESGEVDVTAMLDCDSRFETLVRGTVERSKAESGAPGSYDLRVILLPRLN